MKTFMFFFLLSLYTSTWARCPFVNLSMTDIRESENFRVMDRIIYTYPEKLFDRYQEIIGSFSKTVCEQTGIGEMTLIEVSTSQIYTAFYTNNDECDGGNTFGIVVKDTTPLSDKAVATIYDSDLSCL